jgi:hypothetical protein
VPDTKQLPDKTFSVAAVLYYLMLVAFLAAAFSPSGRVWGVNHWAYFPPLVPVALFIIGAVVPLLVRRFAGSAEHDARADKPMGQSERTYLLTALVVMCLGGLSFYLLRVATHFLGDGYQILEKMSAAQVPLKTTERGEALAHLWLKNLLGADNPNTALLSYQALSIFSGLGVLAATLLCASSLFDANKDRLLFTLGIASGGFMLLFYGYVENYSLFVPAVLCYSLFGVMAARGRISRWWILLPLTFAVSFHVLGVCLVPSAVYLLVSDSRAGREIGSLAKPVKWLVAAILASGVGLVFYHLLTTRLFFRLAFLPPVSDRFTIEGYTLFSLGHLVDFGNLLILLLPGAPLLVALLVLSAPRRIFRERVYRYVSLLVVSTVGAVFVLDPKLGMPRDWDLFAFAAVPLTVGCYLAALDKRFCLHGRKVAMLAVVLGFLLLQPRVVGQSVDTTALSHFKNYLELDKTKNRSARQLLIQHYRSKSRDLDADQEWQRWKNDFPEVDLAETGNRMAREGKLDQAIALNRQAIAVNPIFWIAYSNLGAYFLNMRQYDSAAAYFEIADGLNPFNALILNNLGYAYLRGRRFEKAEAALRYCHSLDLAMIDPVLNLLELYKTTDRPEEYYRYLLVAASNKNAPAGIFKTLGDHYLGARDHTRARAAYDSALKLGFDSSAIMSIRRDNPRLNSKQ